MFDDSTQGAEPIVVLVVPEAHAVQTPESTPVYPALQRQRSNVKPARGDDECEGHVVQLSDPGRLLNVPARHGVQLLRTGRFKSITSSLACDPVVRYILPNSNTPPVYLQNWSLSSSMISNLGVGNNVRSPISGDMPDIR